jgi:hypothetical protein
MTQFENYQWEDHVPRKGSWKFNLAIGALAFGLIAAALPEQPAGTAANIAASAKPTPHFSALDGPGSFTPAAVTGGRTHAQCVEKYADS